METSENNSQGLLAGKKILIVGVRNRRSIAHAIATRARREGAALAFAVQPDARDARGEGNKAAALVDEDFGGAPTVLCDASDDGDIAAAVQKSAEGAGRLGRAGACHCLRPPRGDCGRVSFRGLTAPDFPRRWTLAPTR